MNPDAMKINSACMIGLVAVAVFSVTATACGGSKLEVGAPFGDCMVLQRGVKVPVWGTADAGDEITVRFADSVIAAKADANGRWRADLPAMDACDEGRVFEVKSGDAIVTFKDVLVGEVWWCSGQSNMSLVLWGNPQLINHANRDINGALDAAMTSEPLVRGATVKNSWDSEKQSTGPRLAWKPFVGRDNLRSFSAISFHYALTLHRVLKVPVGVICSAWGGTRIDPWISAEGFESVPEVASNAKAKLTPPLKRMSAVDAAALPDDRKRSLHQQPMVIFNSMVAPYAPFAIRGTIWYQGESNLPDPKGYPFMMKALYSTLSKSFENPDMPLEFVQVAPFHYDWLVRMGPQTLGRFWESQSAFAAQEKNADMVVICDVGEADNIHPVDKRTVALRLAAKSLNRVYGHKEIPCESPTLRSHRIDNGVYTLEFDNVVGWYYRSKQPMRFEIAGSDGRYVPATVKIEGNVIKVSSPEVPDPKHLRYLWNWDWLGYLTNENGFPLGGFRIDE